MTRLAVTVPLSVVALVVSLAGCGSSSSAQPSPSASGAAAGIDGVVAYSGLARDHTTDDVDYPQTPPVGGAHDPKWLTCTGTVYDQPVRDENAVHSMEHGAVWVAYRPDLPADQVATLASDVEGVPYSFMSPYPGIGSPVVLTAWGLQLGVDSADDPRVKEFVDTYANGPQTPEPGASCDGGVMDEEPHDG